ncbi:MAG: glycosyltransferase [Haliscomenobacter sp.]|nr:glycosyltransferase [Haliscomenobacter sp.]
MTLNEIASLVFRLATLAQLAYWVLLFRKLAFYRQDRLSEEEKKEEQPPVSVVICAKNEEANIQQYLTHFLNQKYRSFEVVVVNDGSTDNTWSRLLEFQKKYANLTLVNVPFATPPGKKTALSLGIAHAASDLLLLSDADCRPSSPFWIEKMQQSLPEEKQIALGFSPYEKEQGFLNLFIRFEAVYTAVQYVSFALAGFPYMGVGRNLMYRKSVFTANNGFSGHLHLASGDDDLFVNAVSSKENTATVLEPETFVYTKPKRTWAGYYYQKTRHFSTGAHYRRLHKLLLGGLALSHSLHYLALGILMCAPWERQNAFIWFLARMLVVAGLYFKILKRLKHRDLWPWIPLLDALIPIYYLIFAPSIFFGKNRTWKQ